MHQALCFRILFRSPFLAFGSWARQASQKYCKRNIVKQRQTIFLLKVYAEKVIQYNPRPEEVFKNKKPNKGKKKTIVNLQYCQSRMCK